MTRLLAPARTQRPATRGRAAALVGGLLTCALLTLLPACSHSVSPAPSDGGAGTTSRTTSTTLGVGLSPGFSIIDLSEQTLRRDLTAMRRLGADRVRVDLSWSRVQHTRGAWDWADTDRVFRVAREVGLRVLAVLDYEPRWAVRHDASGQRLSVSPQAFAAFADRASRRYADQVGSWEIWNEPNLEQFWGRAPDADAYAQLVEATAKRIRLRDPRARIVVGALAPATDAADGSEVSPETFLERFYAAGVPRHLYDVVSVHPYSYPALPSEQQQWNTFHRLEGLHALMGLHGDGSKQLWLTEYGAPTGTSGRAVSPQRQAEMVVGALRASRRLGFVGAIFYYALRDTADAPDDLESNFGLITHQGVRKPAYAALRQEIARTRRQAAHGSR